MFEPSRQGSDIDEYGGADTSVVLVVDAAKQTIGGEDANESAEVGNILVECRCAALCDGGCFAGNIEEDSCSVGDSSSPWAFLFRKEFYQVLNFELPRNHVDNEGFGEP